MKHCMNHFCYEYSMIYLFYVQMRSVIEHYNNQSSGCEERPRQTPIMPTTLDKISRAYEICGQYYIHYVGPVLDAIINSVN